MRVSSFSYYFLFRCPIIWCGRLGSNQRPSGYEPPALTPELRPQGYTVYNISSSEDNGNDEREGDNGAEGRDNDKFGGFFNASAVFLGEETERGRGRKSLD